METTMIENIKNALKNGVVTFQFRKKDGSIRTAKGTLNMDIINENYSFKGGDGPSKSGYTSYWDVEKDNWRCFNDNSLIGII